MNSTIADKEDILKFGFSTESILRIEKKVNGLKKIDKDIELILESLSHIQSAGAELSKATNPIHTVTSSKSTLSLEETEIALGLKLSRALGGEPPSLEDYSSDKKKEIEEWTKGPLPMIKKLKEIEIDLSENILALTSKKNKIYVLNGICTGIALEKGGLVDLQKKDKPKGSARSFHLESYLYFEWFTFKKTIPTFSTDSDFVVFCSYFLQKSLDAMIKSFSRSGISSMSKNLSPTEEWTFPSKKP